MVTVEPTTIVVPCFNEAQRLDEHAFHAIVSTGRIRLLFVDDGSTDATADVLAHMADVSDRIEVFTLAANAGKGEAVRRGLLVAVRAGACNVGYYDADMATPPSELLRLTEVLEERPDLAGVFGSRVARLGSTIERNALRHYLGRAYATLASMALGITVYDTQCGAKVFRVDDTLAAALAEPFRSSWAFDVELLDRLLEGRADAPGAPVSAFVEVPLGSWRDVTGSKLHPDAALAALLDLVRIALRRQRRERSGERTRVGAAASVMMPRALPVHPHASDTPPATGGGDRGWRRV
jgi:dolichyl-phosphate beta-glucosyltransferase